MATVSRRSFLKYTGGGLAAAGPLGMLSARTAGAAPPPAAEGYGPLVNKGELSLPAEFNFQVVDRQGTPMRDGRPTPGIFDGMGAFPDAGPGGGAGKRAVLIRNHENRERAGEIKVVTGPGFEYDETAFGGNTKIVVERERAGTDPATGQQLYRYTVVDNFAILGGTSTNCAGGELPYKAWLTCEEVVKRQPNGKKHGYNFEIDAMADGPVVAVPIPQMGRFAHEAATWRSGIIYLTEDRSVQTFGPGPAGPAETIGSVLYRFVPDRRVGQSGILAETTGRLEALAVKGAPRKNMDPEGVPGTSFAVEWVPVPQPDHDDDTDNRRDRQPGFTPTRVQAIDNGAAYFDRQEGMWASSQGGGFKIYFDCTSGGPSNLGQVWEYDPGREVLTLVYVSTSRQTLENPDNVTIVPQTQDILLCEDSSGDQFIRGVTQDGEIYDFAQSGDNDSEFCGACFSPDGQTLFVNQQGGRGIVDESGQPSQGVNPAVTYAIYGPFEKRAGANNKNFATGPAANRR